MKKKIGLYVVMLFMLASCYQDFDLEPYRTLPKIVVRSTPDQGKEMVSVHLGESWFVTDEPKEDSLAGADLKLFVNDISYGAMKYESYGNYYASCPRLNSGDRVKITASKDGFPDVQAESTIPVSVPLTNVDIQVDTLSGGRLNMSFSATFKDISGMKNYYGILVSEEEAYWSTDNKPHFFFDPFITLDTSKDPLFASSYTILDDLFMDGDNSFKIGIIAFDDEKIDGQTYTLHLTEINSVRGVTIERCDSMDMEPPVMMEEYAKRHTYYRYGIIFYSLSAEYYNYLHSKAMLQNDDLANDGFAQPGRLYSNVLGGLGFLGACNSYKSEYIYFKRSYNGQTN